MWPQTVPASGSGIGSGSGGIFIMDAFLIFSKFETFKKKRMKIT
jgi:hypothetical protein